MPHVKIQMDPDDKGTLEVDGVDLTDFVLRDGLSVDFSTTPPTVQVTIPANTLDLNIPGAYIQVFVESSTTPGSGNWVKHWQVDANNQVLKTWWEQA